MLSEIKNQAKSKMEKSVESLKNELSKLRTGRAHPSLLDHLKVEYYGSDVPLSQVANVAVEDARTLTVTPWEKPMVAKIEKVIMISDLGLNPATAGHVIRVPLPALTEERRRDLVRVVKEECEKARVSVRAARRDANQSIKDLLKTKDLSEDESRQGEDEVQSLTDGFIKDVDVIFKQKEQDLLNI